MKKEFKDFELKDFIPTTRNIESKVGVFAHVTSFRVKKWPKDVKRTNVNTFTNLKVSDLL